MTVPWRIQDKKLMPAVIDHFCGFFPLYLPQGWICFVSLIIICRGITIKKTVIGSSWYQVSIQFWRWKTIDRFVLTPLLIQELFLQNLLCAWYWAKCGWWRSGLSLPPMSLPYFQEALCKTSIAHNKWCWGGRRGGITNETIEYSRDSNDWGTQNWKSLEV